MKEEKNPQNPVPNIVISPTRRQHFQAWIQDDNCSPPAAALALPLLQWFSATLTTRFQVSIWDHKNTPASQCKWPRSTSSTVIEQWFFFFKDDISRRQKKVQLDLFGGVPVKDIYSFWAAHDKQTTSFLFHWKQTLHLYSKRSIEDFANCAIAQRFPELLRKPYYRGLREVFIWEFSANVDRNKKTAEGHFQLALWLHPKAAEQEFRPRQHSGEAVWATQQYCICSPSPTMCLEGVSSAQLLVLNWNVPTAPREVGGSNVNGLHGRASPN